jgi:hypothetical protein
MNRALASCSIALAALLAAAGAVAAPTQPDIVYLNACAGGCSVKGGTDSAVLGKSSLLGSDHGVAQFPDTDAIFDQVASCVRHALLPFNIHVVAGSPGTAPRREIMLTTASTALGLAAGLTAASPFDGTAHDDIIAFVFASAFAPSAVDALCLTTAQTIGFLYGIEYVKNNCADIEDPGTGCGEKSFTNQDSTCDGQLFGNPGHCLLGNTTQNSYARVLAVAAATDFLLANSFEGFEVPHAGPSP